MMVQLREMLCPAGKRAVKCPYKRTPSRIVVHNTANDAPAENEVSYMLSNDNEVSFHVAVDDKEIIQAIPFDRNAWASGDGHGVGNMEGIHIEICYSLSGGERFTRAEQNAAEYIAGLLKQFGWGMEKVTKHQDYDGKYCPHRTLDLGWGRFLKMIEAYFKEDDEMVTYKQLKDVPASYQPTIRKLMEKGALVGKSDPDPDSLEDNILDVDEIYCRVMTTLDRLGKLD